MKFTPLLLVSLLLTGCAGFTVIPVEPSNYIQPVVMTPAEYEAQSFVWEAVNTNYGSCEQAYQALVAENGVTAFCEGHYLITNNQFKPDGASGPANLRGTMGPWGYDGLSHGVTDNGRYVRVNLRPIVNAQGFVSGVPYEVAIAWGMNRRPSWSQHGATEEGRMWMRNHGILTAFGGIQDLGNNNFRRQIIANGFGIVGTKLTTGEWRWRFATPDELLARHRDLASR